MPVSILSCNLDRSTAELAEFKVEKNNGSAGSYKLRYNIVMQARSGPINVALQALSGSPNAAPGLWSTYSYQGDTDTASFCKKITVERDLKVETRYYLTANFEPAEPGEIPDISNPTTPNGSPIKSVTNPLNRSPVFWWDRDVTNKLYTIDVNGYVIRNKASDFHTDLIEEDHARSLLVVEFPVASNNAFIALARQYDRAVNASAWTFKLNTYPPRTVLCREVSCSPLIVEGAYRYYTVAMRFAFAPNGETWDSPVPEMGRSYYTKLPSGAFETDAAGYKKRTTVDYDVPLEADGTRRADDQPVLITQVRAKREVDFNPLTQGTNWNSV